jgi:hypothetical protein
MGNRPRSVIGFCFFLLHAAIPGASREDGPGWSGKKWGRNLPDSHLDQAVANGSPQAKSILPLGWQKRQKTNNIS